MKISYKLATGGGYTTLCDDGAGDAFHTQFQPSFRSEIQEELLFAAAAKFRAGRGNAVCNLPVSFNTHYSSNSVAMAAIRTFAGLLDKKLHLKVEEGAEVQYYPNALITSYVPVPTGRSVDHSFQFVSDNVQSTAV